MIAYIDSIIKNLVIHQVGSQYKGEGFRLSEKNIEGLDDTLLSIMKDYFFGHFKEPDFYHFNKKSNSTHRMYQLISGVFANPASFYDSSVEITKHLYQQSTHPNIKNGELMISYLTDIVIEGEIIDAIGIFKSESKDSFLKLAEQTSNYKIYHDQGINIKKLDKGCLVFNTQADSGYKICVIDKSNKSDAAYWKEDFLAIKERPDDYHHTQNCIEITQAFVHERLQPMYELDKTEEASIMHRSKAYLENNELFDSATYSKKIFLEDIDLMNQFDDYKEEYTQYNPSIQMSDTFAISPTALKKHQRFFKSVLKLDKNFHIYIHGNHELIEKGIDDKGQKYYKIYYQNES